MVTCKPKSNTQIQRDFRVRRRAAGMIQVTAWIPASRKEDHKVFVKRLCEDEK